MTRLALVLALALPVGAAAAEPDEGYTVDTGGSTPSLAVGQSGKLVLAIHPRAPWHVDPRAPLKIQIEAPAGLAVAKSSLARKDAVDPKAESPRWETAFRASAPGAQEARAHLKFFLCRETICESRTRTVVFPVAVK
jgi:hypothetical protein